jgi:predicted amidohydrolase
MRRVVLPMILAAVMAVLSAGAQAKSKLRLGMFSAVPMSWDLQGNWRTFERTIAEHANEGIDLIITPECCLDGYVVESKDWTPQRFAAVAQNIKRSHYIQRSRMLAAKYNVYILFGFTQRSPDKFYDSAILVDRTGATVGWYLSQDHPSGR